MLVTKGWAVEELGRCWFIGTNFHLEDDLMQSTVITATDNKLYNSLIYSIKKEKLYIFLVVFTRKVCLNHSRILYDPPPQILEIKAKINKWDLIKIKSFTTKETISKVKRQPAEWEKTIANEATDKQLI